MIFDDLFSAKGKDVEFVLKGKNLTLTTPQSRKPRSAAAKSRTLRHGDLSSMGLNCAAQMRAGHKVLARPERPRTR